MTDLHIHECDVCGKKDKSDKMFSIDTDMDICEICARERIKKIADFISGNYPYNNYDAKIIWRTYNALVEVIVASRKDLLDDSMLKELGFKKSKCGKWY